MEESRAEAIARAVRSRQDDADGARRRERGRRARRRVEKRSVAWLMLAGFAVGAATAHYVGVRVSEGGLRGAFCGGAIGGLWIGWRRRRSAA